MAASASLNLRRSVKNRVRDRDRVGVLLSREPPQGDECHHYTGACATVAMTSSLIAQVERFCGSTSHHIRVKIRVRVRVRVIVRVMVRVGVRVRARVRVADASHQQ